MNARTIRLAPLVYGAARPSQDDPAETYHEASKLYPSFGLRQTRGYLLERSEELRASSLRAVKRHPHLPQVELPPPRLPDTPLAEVVAKRRSQREFGQAPLRLAELAAILHAGYGVTHQLDPQALPGTSPLLRSVPSGGGLYPLELWVFAQRVEGLEPGLYHFDPLVHALESIRTGVQTAALAGASVYPELARTAAVVLVVSAMFWRSRFKYCQRGYRFALLEAGHLSQNVLLVATGLELASVPIGGFFDRRLDELLDLDGVDESALYGLALGRTE